MNASTEETRNRFVILYHQFAPGQMLTPGSNAPPRSSHWDLMFECRGQLLTWAVESEPFQCPIHDAIQLPNHRLDYLHYEGPISGNRGEVKRLLAGDYRIDGDEATTCDLVQWADTGQFQMQVVSHDLSWKISFQHLAGDKWSIKVLADNCQQG